MALLDVDQPLVDPDFTDTISVRRQQQDTDGNGRLVVQETLFEGVIAVVTMSNPNDLFREDSMDYFSRSINVVTKFRLRGETDGFKADIVLWRGNNYQVESYVPYPQFGNGYYKVICSSIDRNDNALDPIIQGQFAFNDKNNSQMVSIVC